MKKMHNLLSILVRRITTQPKALYNVVLPLIFFEVWSVLLAFICVVIIEALVIKSIIKDDLLSVIKKIAFVNFLTTVVGYLLQGIIRFITLILSTIIVPEQATTFWHNEFIAGLFGNVGSNSMPMRLFEKVPISTSVEIGTSFLITFVLSVVIESRSLKKKYKWNEDIQKVIPTAVLKANIVSYSLLLIWVVYYIKTH